MRYALAIALLLCMLASASARPRCHRTHQNLNSGHGWNNTCYTTACHKAQTQSGGWQESILNIKKWQLNYSAFNDALKSISPQSYGQAAPYGAPAGDMVINGVSTATQGSSLWGVNQYAAQIATPDISYELHQAGQLAKDSQDYGAQAQANFETLLGQINSNNTNVAAILARGHVAAQALHAASGTPETREQTVQFQARISRGGKVEIVQDQQSPDDTPAIPTEAPGPPGTMSANMDAQRAAVIENECARCHGASDPDGGFSIVDYQSWAGPERAAKIEAIQRHVTSSDPAVRMPRTDDGPGEPLPWEKQKLFIYWR